MGSVGMGQGWLGCQQWGWTPCGWQGCAVTLSPGSLSPVAGVPWPGGAGGSRRAEHTPWTPSAVSILLLHTQGSQKQGAGSQWHSRCGDSGAGIGAEPVGWQKEGCH